MASSYVGLGTVSLPSAHRAAASWRWVHRLAVPFLMTASLTVAGIGLSLTHA